MLPVRTGIVYKAKLKWFLCYPPHSTVYTQKRRLEMAVGLVVPETQGGGVPVTQYLRDARVIGVDPSSHIVSAAMLREAVLDGAHLLILPE